MLKWFAGLGLKSLLPWAIGVVVSGAVLGGGWLWHQHKTDQLELALQEERAANALLEENVADWMAHAEQMQAQMQREREKHRQADLAVRHLLLELGAVRRETEPLITEIEAAPPADDGPVAPVLERALRGLAR